MYMILPMYTARIENLYKCAPTSELKTFTHKYTHASVCTHTCAHTQIGQMPKMDVRNTQTHGEFINITDHSTSGKPSVCHCSSIFLSLFNNILILLFAPILIKVLTVHSPKVHVVFNRAFRIAAKLTALAMCEQTEEENTTL